MRGRHYEAMDCLGDMASESGVTGDEGTNSEGGRSTSTDVVIRLDHGVRGVSIYETHTHAHMSRAHAHMSHDCVQHYLMILLWCVYTHTSGVHIILHWY